MKNHCLQEGSRDNRAGESGSLWFSVYERAPYPGAEPAFQDPAEFSWADPIAARAAIVRAELEAYMERHGDAQPYFRRDMVSGGEWQTLPLMTWGLRYSATLQHFPETASALAEVPGLVSAAFNILRPGARIHPHFGDTNATVRCHLGLRVPTGLPDTGLRVAGEDRAWEEGGWLLFCDGFEHSAWNLSTEPRQVLLLDVVRPQFLDRRNEICATVLGSLATQALWARLGGRTIPPRPTVTLMHPPARLAARMLAPIYNALGRYRHGPTPLDTPA